MKRSPNLIILGAQKCGSTSLRFYLSQHPDIYMKKEEIHFFKTYWNRGVDWYLDLFKDREEKYIGEKTPNYLYQPETPKRIKEVCPDVKFIILLRNPVNRAYSSYWFWRLHGYIHMIINSFEDLVFSKNTDWRQIKAFGEYIVYIKNYLQYFPKDRFLFIKTEDFHTNRQEVLNQVCDFLQLPHFIPKDTKRVNVGCCPSNKPIFLMSIILSKILMINHRRITFIQKYGHKANNKCRALQRKLSKNRYPPMKNDTRKFLNEYYKSFNEELYEEVGIKW
jgi:hypothetical protein